MKNGLDEQYIDLLTDILENGVEKNTRNGKVLSVFGRTIRYKFKDGKFPLLTTKKMAWKSICTELLWFLRGKTNIKYLVDNDCHIWDGDTYKNFKSRFSQMPGIQSSLPTKEEFIDKIKNQDGYAEKWGELGPIYGKQWREWKTEVAIPTTLKIDDGDDIEPLYVKGTQYIDQIQNLINDLKTNPDSRRLMVSAWNVGELDQMVLLPCHYGFQVYTRELSDEERLSWMKNNKSNVVLPTRDPSIEFSMDEWFRPYGVPKRAIPLMFNMRSNDVPLGLPFNIASYGLLLEIIGIMVNMIPDELIANLGDAHIYKNQIDGVKEQLTRTPMKLPNLIISDDANFNGTIDEFLESCNKDSFKLNGYESHPSIKIPLSN